MIVAGIGTLIQLFLLWEIGSGLPIVMGISFIFVSVFCKIGPAYGYNAIVGAVLVGGIVEGILGLLAKYWLNIITPIVSASVVTAIGFSLLPVGAAFFGGGNITIAALSLSTGIGFTQVPEIFDIFRRLFGLCLQKTVLRWCFWWRLS